MDNELFELCKEVYKKKPSWFTGDWFLQDPDGKIIGKAHPKILKMDREWKNGYRTDAPLYTSDYLLEKLPQSIDAGRSLAIDMFLVLDRPKSLKYWYRAFYIAPSYGKRHVVVADTPLKALLKLTIALSEAGELK